LSGIAVQHADDGYSGRGNFGGSLVHINVNGCHWNTRKLTFTTPIRTRIYPYSYSCQCECSFNAKKNDADVTMTCLKFRASSELR